MEGFREIFPQNGDMVTAQVMAYLGMEYSTAGLWLRPRVPSDLDGMTFSDIGYAGGLLDFQATALREEVPATPDTGEPGGAAFQTHNRFNRVGLRVPMPSPGGQDDRFTLVLERLDPDGWKPVASTWFNDLPEDGRVWLTVDQWLQPGRYRLRTAGEDKAVGASSAPAFQLDAAATIRCQAQRIRLTVHVDASSPRRDFRLHRGNGGVEGPSTLLDTVLEPGQRACLYPPTGGPAK